ncbi:DNA mismatch repair protein [alpha proteobacterium HTCC2255]|nr:DNA mismatch repair protein [alpha proteobacterium HTCC2255] [Rhodobacterales bacterium HTCC2255]
MSIQILSAQLANQIAAGEVVERPASIVKELVENSIDAGATKIDILIEQGGHKRITIVDNGCGIVKDELALALSRHATSKIHTIDDLTNIASLGFRGEALASISSVSRLTLTSKPASQSEAWQVHCEGRDMDVIINPAAHPDGSTVDVVDLFYNTPARRKFLKTHKTEFTHIDELLKRIALAAPHVGIKLTHNGKVIRHTPAQNIEKRIDAVCGKGFVTDCVCVEREYQGTKVRAWLTKPMVHRNQNDVQYTFVNGRMMRDKLINHAIKQAYEGLIDSQFFPGYVVFIEVPLGEVDVNVHPAKHEVRFVNSRIVHDFLYQSMSEALHNGFSDNTASTQDYAELTVEHDYIVPLEQQQNTYSSGAQSNSGVSYPRANASGLSAREQATAASNYGTMHTGTMGRVGGNVAEQVKREQSLALPAGQMLILSTPLEGCDLLIQAKQLQVCSSIPVIARYLHDQMIQAETQQPLLLPVSVNVTLPEALLTSLEASFERAQWEIECIQAGQHAQKWILKKVPSTLRSLPWSRLFGQILANIKLSQATDFEDDLYTLLVQELHHIPVQYDSYRQTALHWFATLTNAQQSNIIKTHLFPVQLTLSKSEV